MDNAPSQTMRGSLLVVDDDLGARQTLSALLFQEGYETRCAPDGKTALMFAEADPPELILLDVRLPDLDGFEVCRRLKSSDKTDRIPVIFLSGLDDVGDKIRGFESGGVDYITKPFQAAEVLARVETHLALHRLRKQAETQNVVLDAMVQERTRELVGITESLVREINERERIGVDLEERLRFESMLSDVSARFVRLPSDRLDAEIENALKKLLDFFRVDRCGLLRVLPGKASWMITHAVYSEHVPPVPEGVELPRAINPWAYDKLTRKREVLSFSSLEDVPAEADVDKKTWIEWGIRSNLIIPIIAGESVSHLIAINSVKSERVWPEEFIPRLRLLGEVFANALERTRMENELRERFEEIEGLKSQLEKENINLREELSQGQGFEKIIGSSDALNYVLFRVGQVAPTDATVLILGETGTGKGMVANAIHGLSGRKDRPMITVNCAALPANLIESELFGREKGAFTGAYARQAGRFEVADKGTIFLDEIGELPLELQSKLLRVLQDGEFERLGSAKTVKVDARVIASTSRDLKEEVRAGRFREDLFYRLNVFPVSIPPLRKRADDIPQLVRFFTDKYARKIGRLIETVPKAAMKTLEEYPWPGNVRELEHIIERAVITTTGPVLQIADRLEPLTDPDETDTSMKDMAAMEREHILRVLRETGWKIEGAKGAATILNIHPSTLRFRIKKLGIKRP
jgi:formate hydrogenlyase transcriptional activator